MSEVEETLADPPDMETIFEHPDWLKQIVLECLDDFAKQAEAGEVEWDWHVFGGYLEGYIEVGFEHDRPDKESG